jgi:hypothetical protein
VSMCVCVSHFFSFCDRVSLCSLLTLSLRSFQLSLSSATGMSLYAQLHTTTSFSTHPLMDALVVSMSWQLWLMLQWTWEYRHLYEQWFSFLWCIPRRGIAGIGGSSFNFSRNLTFFTVSAPIYIPTNVGMYRFPLLHTLINTCHLLSLLIGDVSSGFWFAFPWW